MIIRPISFKEANLFVNKYHRHHGGTVGCKFCISLRTNDENIIGVAICGRPVSRYLDDGTTLEINRLCIQEGFKNGCSMLYGRCCRIAKMMGYKKVITYTLKSENGASLKASNFINMGECGGKYWRGSRNTGVNTPKEKKYRWEVIL